MDTNEEERAKGKTVEVGRAHFDSASKRYTILDAPGHKNYVPNMIAGQVAVEVEVVRLLSVAFVRDLGVAMFCRSLPGGCGCAGHFSAQGRVRDRFREGRADERTCAPGEDSGCAHACRRRQ